MNESSPSHEGAPKGYSDLLPPLELKVTHKILCEYGALIEALVEGIAKPQNRLQERLVKAGRGELVAETVYEYAWVDYQLSLALVNPDHAVELPRPEKPWQLKTSPNPFLVMEETEVVSSELNNAAPCYSAEEEKPPRQEEPWTQSEALIALKAWRAGVDLYEIARRHKRHDWEIDAKLSEYGEEPYMYTYYKWVDEEAARKCAENPAHEELPPNDDWFDPYQDWLYRKMYDKPELIYPEDSDDFYWDGESE